MNCLVETTIPLDMILYLSFYYLVNDLVQLTKSDHQSAHLKGIQKLECNIICWHNHQSWPKT